MTSPSTRQNLTFGAALVGLNASLTFGNLWPTPWIRWQWQVSLEFLALLLVLAAVAALGRTLSPRLLRMLAVIWVVLTIGHYLDVTAPALYGRRVNLYWDLPHVSNVAAMLAGAAVSWRVALVVVALLLVPLLLYGPARWAIGRVALAMPQRRTRWSLAALALVALAAYPIEQRRLTEWDRSRFADPVSTTFARQVVLLAQGVAADRTGRFVPASPPLQSDLSRVQGADVLLIFIESYGAVSFDRPSFASALAAPRAGLDAVIRDTGRRVVSAFVESPTFGGSSWLAHLSLLSGIEVRDADMNQLVMMQRRNSVVTLFSRRGYRTVAAMPGLRQAWPEGAFYGFDALYDMPSLAYRGPEFGWWSTPDQYTVAETDARELASTERAPVFLFFPTTATHAPFGPTAPYQPDWGRIRTPVPYDKADVERTYLQEPDWLDLSPGYVRAMTYTYDVLGGYLRTRADRDLVMILIGDHQPPAAVSGERASWNVPVHVITSRSAVLERLAARGFVPGLTPNPPALSRMHALLPVLLAAFGDPGAPLDQPRDPTINR